MPALAESAMNALAHALEARWSAAGGPLTDAVAERGAHRLCHALVPEHPDRDALALGAVEAAHAFGLVGTGVHHIVCQTIVRALATPHAATNAVILPHAFALMATRAPEAIDALDRALDGDAGSAIRTAAARSGVTRLRELGHGLDDYRALVPAMLARPDLARTPGIDGQALASLLEAAW
jgi:maleylacetate reductase